MGDINQKKKALLLAQAWPWLCEGRSPDLDLLTSKMTLADPAKIFICGMQRSKIFEPWSRKSDSHGAVPVDTFGRSNSTITSAQTTARYNNCGGQFEGQKFTLRVVSYTSSAIQTLHPRYLFEPLWTFSSHLQIARTRTWFVCFAFVFSESFHLKRLEPR